MLQSIEKCNQRVVAKCNQLSFFTKQETEDHGSPSNMYRHEMFYKQCKGDMHLFTHMHLWIRLMTQYYWTYPMMIINPLMLIILTVMYRLLRYRVRSQEVLSEPRLPYKE